SLMRTINAFTAYPNGASAGTASPTPSPTPAPTPAPTPTPAPSPAPTEAGVGMYNDTTFTYSGAWQVSQGAGKYLSDDHYARTAGNTYSFNFTGTGAKLYAAKAPHHSIMAIRIDGGAETMVDLYGATRSDQVLAYTSPTLAAGKHTITVRVTGTKNASATDQVIVADRLDVTATPLTPTPTPSPTPAPSPVSPITPPPVSVPIKVPAPTSAITGLSATYFPTRTLDGQGISKLDKDINFNWGAASPLTGIPADSFSVRWTGTVTPTVTGSHTFTTLSDDGVRLWVDNKLVIDDWTNHAVHERAAAVSLTAGKPVNIRVEYYEAGGFATVKLLWAAPGQVKAVVPTSALRPGPAQGLLASFYARDTGKFLASRIDATVDNAWGYSSPNVGVPADNFAADWTGKIKAPTTGTYTIKVRSDDGVRVWIGGKLLVNRWNDHSVTTDTVNFAFVAGETYDIKIAYYESLYNATLQLRWSGPGLAEQVIPATALTIN
ncbi:MAG TPA: PA14 domain-containing protein, partial [Hymenobacter sp.]